MHLMSEIKEYNAPLCPAPRYNEDCTELLLYIPSVSISENKLIFSNHGRTTINFKSIHIQELMIKN
jgi:hypothetical protein